MSDQTANNRILKADNYANWQNADNIVAAAEARAAEIIASAESAYKKSQEKGYEEGLKNAKRESINQAFNTVDGCIEYVRSCEAGLVDVALNAIEKVVLSRKHEEITRTLVQQGLQRMLGGDEVLVRVPNGKIPYYQSVLDDHASGQKIRFIECSNQAENECLLESSLGVIKISRAEQLESLRQQIHDTLPKK